MEHLNFFYQLTKPFHKFELLLFYQGHFFKTHKSFLCPQSIILYLFLEPWSEHLECQWHQSFVFVNKMMDIPTKKLRFQSFLGRLFRHHFFIYLNTFYLEFKHFWYRILEKVRRYRRSFDGTGFASKSTLGNQFNLPPKVPPALSLHFDITGCQVFKGWIQNQIDFGPQINIVWCECRAQC